MFGKTRRIHFVGIGGAGMSGIAEILLAEGFHISGSDLSENENTRRLSQMGARVFLGHSAQHVGAADVVVVSAAVPEDNPEIREARRRGIPVIPRAEMLAELMKLKYSIAVGGTHGKTTTTALIGTVLEAAGLDPTVIDGGRLVHLGSGARVGRSEFLVAEADEAYGSIKRFHPTVAVVTAVDADHLDYYRNVEEIKEVFLSFMNRVPFYGMTVACLDQENVQALLPEVEKRLITYGVRSAADVTAGQLEFSGTTSRFLVRYRGEPLGKVRLPLPGEHNVQNALAAVCVGIELEIPFPTIARALAEFQGVHRRFEVLGEVGGVLIVDDYAHNPQKLKAVFAGAKAGFPDRRLLAVFQPHRYHRVHTLAEEFSRSFFQADRVYVTRIYGAGEAPIAGVSAERLAEAIRAHGHREVVFLPTQEALLERLLEEVRPGDLVLTVGAGDIWKVGKRLLEQLQAKERPGATSIPLDQRPPEDR
ncbi:MAG: UDP-N-acetylmuramate--L-alanine ligase [Candidatus Poribacteria bacterium]|nr:MAG: UDP-N-acetylmuramate--L-alanine ligase [Candidatus Poribacteria bacterium]